LFGRFSPVLDATTARSTNSVLPLNLSTALSPALRDTADDRRRLNWFDREAGIRPSSFSHHDLATTSATRDMTPAVVYKPVPLPSPALSPVTSGQLAFRISFRVNFTMKVMHEMCSTVIRFSRILLSM
jgi:hypothetical protein